MPFVDHTTPPFAERIAALLARLSLDEKIGQLQQVAGAGGHVSDDLARAVREGRVGSVINEVHAPTVNALQWIAVHESRHGIPLLIGRDVIHGFATVFPIPLGQAASWNPEVVERGARIAAREAAACGVNWTFAPMIDIGRDPRWGRVAEGYGEDPYLTATLAAAAVRGTPSPPAPSTSWATEPAKAVVTTTAPTSPRANCATCTCRRSRRRCRPASPP